MSNALNNAAKLAPVFHLTEPRFGYVAGTGVNNTAALQAAITAATAVGGTLLLPEAPTGGYIEHTGLTISGAVTIVGAGKFRSRLRLLGSAATGADGITFADNVDVADVHLQDLGLYGRYPSLTSGHAIYLPDEVTLSYGRGLKITRVYATDWGGKGLYVGANRNNGKAYDFEATRCEDSIYIDNSSDWKFTAGEFGIARQYCVNIPGAGADNKFTDCSMWQSQESAVNLGTTGSSPNLFIGCTFDHHEKNGVRISGSATNGQPHAFIGCWFRENSEVGDGLHAQILLTNTAGSVFIGNRFTDQEGAPKASYVVEFSGTTGGVTWIGNYVEGDAYTTSITNVASNLIAEAVNLLASGYLETGGILASSGTADIDLKPGTSRVRAMRAKYVASGVNWIDLYPAATGGAVRVVAASSTDTHVDLSLEPQGTEGCVVFPTDGLRDYADDAAAATGGVPVRGLYHTSGAVKMRVA